MSEAKRIARNAMTMLEETPLRGKDIPAAVEVLRFLEEISAGHKMVVDVDRKDDGEEGE